MSPTSYRTALPRIMVGVGRVRAALQLEAPFAAVTWQVGAEPLLYIYMVPRKRPRRQPVCTVFVRFLGDKAPRGPLLDHLKTAPARR